MSRDNWATLVEAVVRREQIWQMFHNHSRSPSISTIESEDDLTSNSSAEITKFVSFSDSLMTIPLSSPECAKLSSPSANLRQPPANLRQPPANRRQPSSSCPEVQPAPPTPVKMSRYIYGPEEGDLLYLQDMHRSEYVFNGHIDRIVIPRHNNTTGFSHDPEDDRYVHINDDIIAILYDMGFYGVFSCGYILSDAHLITALLERWRMETHTFHLSVGEATITLEDVAVLWGLPIRGDPIIGIDAPPAPYESWMDCCGGMLGFFPFGDDLSGSRIKMIALRRQLVENPLNPDSPAGVVMQHARCAALLIMGAYMFPDTSGNKVSLLYLRHMRTVEECRSYSWGSAVLAFLYRELCGASNSCNHNQNIGGALQLLQMWAWIRISSIRPDRRAPRMPVGVRELSNGRVLPIPPYGVRWTTYFSWTHTTRNSVRIFRAMLDNLSPYEFDWMPYDMSLADIQQLPEECAPELWRCPCPLIHYNIIEELHLERVTRQFGIVQSIPPHPQPPREVRQTLHGLTRKGYTNKDWNVTHAIYIARWFTAHEHQNEGERVSSRGDVVEGYHEWYKRKTRKFISPPPRIHDNGYRPPDHATWNAMSTGLAYMMDNYLAITDDTDPVQLRSLCETNREVVRSLQDVERGHANPEAVSEQIRVRRGSRSRRRVRSPEQARPTASQPHPPAPVTSASPSFGQWDSNPHSAFAPSVASGFEGVSTSEQAHYTAYTPYFSHSDSVAGTPQIIAFNEATYRPQFGTSPVPCSLEGNEEVTVRPPIRRSKRIPRARGCGTGGHLGHQGH